MDSLRLAICAVFCVLTLGMAQPAFAAQYELEPGELVSSYGAYLSALTSNGAFVFDVSEDDSLILPMWTASSSVTGTHDDSHYGVWFGAAGEASSRQLMLSSTEAMAQYGCFVALGRVTASGSGQPYGFWGWGGYGNGSFGCKAYSADSWLVASHHNSQSYRFAGDQYGIRTGKVGTGIQLWGPSSSAVAAEESVMEWYAFVAFTPKPGDPSKVVVVKKVAGRWISGGSGGWENSSTSEVPMGAFTPSVSITGPGDLQAYQIEGSKVNRVFGTWACSATVAEQFACGFSGDQEVVEKFAASLTGYTASQGDSLWHGAVVSPREVPLTVPDDIGLEAESELATLTDLDWQLEKPDWWLGNESAWQRISEVGDRMTGLVNSVKSLFWPLFLFKDVGEIDG